MSDFQVLPFSEIDLSDAFFDSLKSSYPEFCDWYKNKAEKGQNATVYYQDGKILDFLYLKVEEESICDDKNYHYSNQLPSKKRLKVGTFKVDSRGTRRGERLMKRLLDYAVSEMVEEVYVTIFPEHTALIALFVKYGFVEMTRKYHPDGRYENVYVKSLTSLSGNILQDYPFVHKRGVGKYLLSIYPKYHTLLFPDSILTNESYDIIKDLSPTNSIHKAYICFMQDVKSLNPGDNVVIYRTTDIPGKAYYRSVVSSICVVERVQSKSEFVDVEDFINQVKDYSIFPEKDLRLWYRKPNLFLIKLTYNVALTKRVTRATLINEVGISGDEYWGFMKLTEEQYCGIISKGAANESYFVD